MEQWMSFSEICRLCVGSVGLRNLFRDKMLLRKVLVITGIKMVETDQLPQQICSRCVDLINRAYNFRSKCQDIDRQLNKSLTHDYYSIVVDDNDGQSDANYDDEVDRKDILTEPRQFKRSNSEEIEFQPESVNVVENPDEFLREEYNSDVSMEDNKNDDDEESQDYKSNKEDDDETFDSNKNVGQTRRSLRTSPKKKERQSSASPHPKKKKFPGQRVLVECKLCQRNFTTGTIQAHSKFHTDKDIPCQLCNVWEINELSMKSHIKIVHNLNPETMKPLVPQDCRYCEQKFDIYGELVEHEKSHREHFECEICHETFAAQGLLNIHQKVHVGQTADGQYQCEKCEKAFSTRRQLKKHTMSVHTNEKRYQCEKCPLKFVMLENLKKHLATHGSKDYPCTVCTKSFYMESQLNHHVINEHDNTAAKNALKKPTVSKKVECEICNKAVLRNYYPTHLLTHSGERNYKCSYCGKKFTTKEYLRDHENIHKNIRPYACEVCGMKFRKSHHLKTHSKTHTGEQPHACSFCGKKFAGFWNMKLHEKIHTGERPHKCDTCGAGFLALNVLRKHKLMKHNQEL